MKQERKYSCITNNIKKMTTIFFLFMVLLAPGTEAIKDVVDLDLASIAPDAEMITTTSSSPPYVSFFFPSPDETAAPIDTAIYAEILGDDGVDISSVEMYVAGLRVTPETAYIDGGVSVYFRSSSLPSNDSLCVTIEACAANVASSSLGPMFAATLSTGTEPGCMSAEYTITTGNWLDELGPNVYLGGYGSSPMPTERSGGMITLRAFVSDPERPHDIWSVELAYEGVPVDLPLYDDGMHDDFSANDGIYGISMFCSPGAPPGLYLLEILTTDFQDNPGPLWPYLNFGSPGLPPSASRSMFRETMSIGRGSGHEPFVEYAGFWNTRLDPHAPGMLRIVAVVSDPDGYEDIYQVYLVYEGEPIGLTLYDDGYHGDFSPRDSIFGYEIALGPGTPPGFYEIDIVAEDTSGLTSIPWPYLGID